MKNLLLLSCYYISAFLAMSFSTEFYKCVIKHAENTLVNETPSQSIGIKKYTGALGSYVDAVLGFNIISVIKFLLPI